MYPDPEVMMLRGIPLLCAVLLAAGCDTDVPIQDDRPTEPTARPDQQAFRSADEVIQNPCDSETVGLNPHLAAPVLTGDSAHSNEVHDCQKLVVMKEGQPAFGPLVAIWPIAAAADADTTVFLDGRNVATVVNHGSEGYAPLGLVATAIHCLRLTYDSGTFSAVMFVPANQSEFCLENHPPETDDTTGLEVKVADQWPDGALSAVPPTARIGWSSPPDSQSLSSVAGTPRAEHYLGVYCAGEWCGVGPADFAFATTDRASAGTGPAVTPGYYDEQFIAVPVAPGDTALKPGPWAVIQPTNDFHEQDTTSWKGGKHVVAHVMVDRGSGSDAEDHILKKLGFRPTGLGGPSQAANAVLLEFHGKDKVDSDGNPDPFSAEHRSRPPTGPDWDQLPSEITFVPHSAHGVKGSVRWRWNADDETGWINCQLGCCESGGAY